MNASHILTILGSRLSADAVDLAEQAVARHSLQKIEQRDSAPGMVAVTLSGSVISEDALRVDLIALEDKLGADINLQTALERERRHRLFIFDMDSTLIEAEVIDELAKLAGMGEQVAAVTAATMRGELDFKQSFTRRLGMLRGVREQDVLAMLERIPLTPGAETLMRTLKVKGCRTAVVSGGFSFAAEHLQRRLGIDHVHTNALHIIDGSVTGVVSGAIIDGSRKAELLREIAREESVPLEEVVAIGDGANDLQMLSAAGVSVAYRAKPVLRQAAKLRITHSPLDSLLHLVRT